MGTCLPSHLLFLSPSHSVHAVVKHLWVPVPVRLCARSVIGQSCLRLHPDSGKEISASLWDLLSLKLLLALGHANETLESVVLYIAGRCQDILEKQGKGRIWVRSRWRRAHLLVMKNSLWICEQLGVWWWQGVEGVAWLWGAGEIMTSK